MTVKLTQWQAVRKDVKLVNRELYNLIESLGVDETYPLIEAEFDYGAPIVVDGQIPSDSPLMQYQDLLDYSAIPLGLVMTKGGR